MRAGCKDTRSRETQSRRESFGVLDPQCIHIAEEAARRGGAVLQEWRSRFTVSEKGPADLVTEADFAAQETIHVFIRDHFPDHAFLGEEQLKCDRPDSKYRWIIDPLDGTSNYVHGFPYYAVSIGLEYEHELVAGVIFDPTRDEMFSAVRGQGARLNGRPIHASPIQRASEAMLMASLPRGVQRSDPAIVRFLQALHGVQTVQRSGSAALNLAYTAAGRIDGFFSSSLKPWDMAAGVVIVIEAGGIVSALDGKPFDVNLPEVLACNNSVLHEQLKQLLAFDNLSPSC